MGTTGQPTWPNLCSAVCARPRNTIHAIYVFFVEKVDQFRLEFRVSLDHYTQALHEIERGPKAWDRAMTGLRWLARHGFKISIAGRTCWGETEARARTGYARLFAGEGIELDTHDPAALVLFPEMDATLDVPEITNSCWGILGVNPDHGCRTPDSEEHR